MPVYGVHGATPEPALSRPAVSTVDAETFLRSELREVPVFLFRSRLMKLR